MKIENKSACSIPEINKSLKTYSGIAAKIKSLLNKTIKVDGGAYYDKKDLTKAIVKIITDDKDLSSKLQSSKKIQKKVASLVEKYSKDPDIEQDVILHLLTNVMALEIGSKPASKVDFLLLLDEIDPDNIPSLKWPSDDKDLAEIEAKLKPGDIIFRQNRGELHGPVERSIVKSQKMSKHLLKGKLEPAVETYVHVAIYLGDGKFAEATPGYKGHDVRILPLNHKKLWNVMPGHEFEYRICRAKNEEIGKEAAKLAESYAELKVKDKEDFAGGPTKLKYGYRHSILSLVRNPKFDKKAKKGILAESYMTSIPEFDLPKTSKGKDRDFFCSYFVAYCFQVGNVGLLLDDLIEKHQLQPPKEELEGKSEKEKVKIINKWAKKVIKDNPSLLDEINLTFNSKTLSVQKLRSLLSNNPEHFEDAFRILPASASQHQ